VVASDARLIWGPVLRATSALDLTLVTTNYDRAIELAANAENVPIDDGFGAFGQRETASWAGFTHDGDRPLLVKLHGQKGLVLRGVSREFWSRTVRGSRPTPSRSLTQTP
jgi:hypothetical protein